MFLNVPLSLALHRFGLILFFKFLFPDIISAIWYRCISEPFLEYFVGWSFLEGCFLWGRCHLTWFSQLFHLPQEGVVSGSLCWHDGCNDSMGYSAFRVQWFSSFWRVSMLWRASLVVYSLLGCCSRGVMLSVYFSKMISVLIVPINSSFIIIVIESSCFKVFFYAVYWNISLPYHDRDITSILIFPFELPSCDERCPIVWALEKGVILTSAAWQKHVSSLTVREGIRSCSHVKWSDCFLPFPLHPQ